MTIVKLLGLLVLFFQVSCGSKGIGDIPDTEVIVLIPFEDAMEAMSITTVSKKERLYTPAETEEMLPELVCKKLDDWNEWRKFSLKACRLAIRDGEKCVLHVKSVGDGLVILEEVIQKIKR